VEALYLAACGRVLGIAFSCGSSGWSCRKRALATAAGMAQIPMLRLTTSDRTGFFIDEVATDMSNPTELFLSLI
jgi:hypothetical protein